MTIHIEREGLSVCGNLEETDELTTLSNVSNCIECRYFDEVQELWENYVAQPSNFGGDEQAVVFAEHDAYFAGAFDILKRLENR